MGRLPHTHPSQALAYLQETDSIVAEPGPRSNSVGELAVFTPPLQMLGLLGVVIKPCSPAKNYSKPTHMWVHSWWHIPHGLGCWDLGS